MARRRMTLRRIDPWSVLKFGLIANLCVFAVVLLGAAILWWVIRQIGLVEQACELATSVGFEECGVDGGALFRYLLLLGGLGVVVATGLYVFGAFLHNLISDLVGGVTVTVVEEGGGAGTTVAARHAPSTTTERPRRSDASQRPAAAAAAPAAPVERREQPPEPQREEEPAPVRPGGEWRRPESERPSTPVRGEGGDASAPWPWERERRAPSEERRSDERLFGGE